MSRSGTVAVMSNDGGHWRDWEPAKWPGIVLLFCLLCQCIEQSVTLLVVLPTSKILNVVCKIVMVNFSFLQVEVSECVCVFWFYVSFSSLALASISTTHLLLTSTWTLPHLFDHGTNGSREDTVSLYCLTE